MSVDVRGLKITIGGKPIVSDADMTLPTVNESA